MSDNKNFFIRKARSVGMTVSFTSMAELNKIFLDPDKQRLIELMFAYEITKEFIINKYCKI
ncbi:MAG: hypothetical protein AABY15_07050 [Nanoarchaeota archaeon]